MEKLKTKSKQWKLYRDEPEIELVGEYATKNEAVDAVNWANDEAVVFSYNYKFKVWDAGDYTLTKTGHPQLIANEEYERKKKEVEN